MKIYNLTQHTATPEQVEAGVVEVSEMQRGVLKAALNFTGVPDMDSIEKSASMMASVMNDLDPDLTGEVGFMVGGYPNLMCALVQYAPSYQMLFACSDRVSEEVAQADGSVRKVNIFKHLGFIPMYCDM